MINQSIQIGKKNKLKINRITTPGVYLEAQDEMCVLLPNKYTTQEMSVGDILEVFVYNDSEDRMVATTTKPFVSLGEFGFLEVVDKATFGVFLDWGLEKDLLLPKNKQKIPARIGEHRIVKVVMDSQTNRLIATQKFELEKDTKDLSLNEKIEVFVYAKSPLGYKVVVNNQYEGLIYHNEIFQKIKVGDKTIGYIKNIRDDNKLDISLQPIGAKNDDIAKEKILEALKNSDGALNITTKSDADKIKDIVGLSKKSYKKALNSLIKEEIVYLENGLVVFNPNYTTTSTN